jgi:ERCC4-related helicase
MPAAECELLPNFPWATSYRHEDGDLIELFFIPALSRAIQYDRTTGYFTADALALAARGLEKLIANGGRMRLIVGCTLDEAEVKAIEDGYDFQTKLKEHMLARVNPDWQKLNGIQLLTWMVAHERLELKVAVPSNGSGKPVAAPGIYHEKVGIIADRDGNRIAFSGSINETRGGWINNRESFHVYPSWNGEPKHCQDEVEAFSKLWEGRARTVLVVDFPDAVKSKMLEWLPKDDRFVMAPLKTDETPTVEPEQPLPMLPDEKRSAVWTFIRNAARMPNGRRVGEVTSAITPWPHQAKAYQRMLDAWPCQLLIADEVGLGKTITAGLFLRQAWLAGLAKRILILAPSKLLTQWQGELYEKFNLNVPIYDGQQLAWYPSHGWQGTWERKVPRDTWHREPFVLCSSHLMRRRDRGPDLLKADNWDLIVLDEAHHARRKSPGGSQEGGPNKLMQLMQDLRPKTKALVLLTATPMQVHPVELLDLLNLLGLPEQWHRQRFLQYFELVAGNPDDAGLKYLASAFLDTEKAFGAVADEQLAAMFPDLSPLACRKVLKALRDSSGIPLKRLNAGERRAALETLRRFSPVRFRMIRHTRNLLREYHRRGLLVTPIAKRDVRDLPLNMTPSEKALYDAVEKYIGETYDKAAPNQRSAVGFVMTIYRRRLASSFYALQQTLTKRLAGIGGVVEEDVSQDEQVDEVMDTDDATATAELVREEHESIRGLLKAIAKVGTNTKARVLVEQLEMARADGYESAIVFTQYADTMDYLKDHLAQALPGRKVACYSGDGGQIRDTAGFWTACTKEQIKQHLKSGMIDLLVCTDAAAEGLNLQFCGAMVNYDLPWNPMKVEQRIGRIDRIGQKHSIIRVINLAYKETVEADVYFAVGSRIKLFEGLVGRLQPILSQLPKQFETVTLKKPDEREAARHRLLADLEYATQKPDQTPLDIDEVAADALAMAESPDPSLTLDELDAALNRPELLPPAVELRPLDRCSYGLRIPGFDRELRVTTSAEVFDDHFQSHDFLSPGGRVFDHIAAMLPGIDESNPNPDARIVLTIDETTSTARFFDRSAERTTEILNLQQLLSALEDCGCPSCKK